MLATCACVVSQSFNGHGAKALTTLNASHVLETTFTISLFATLPSELKFSNVHKTGNLFHRKFP